MTAVGRLIVRTIFRIDIGNLVNLKTDEPDAQVLARWIRILAQCLDLIVAWLCVWLVAHFSMVAIGAIVVGPRHGAPLLLLLFVEGIPGFFVALMAGRLGLAMTMTTRVIPAVGDARGTGQSPPAWTQRPGLLILLSSPSDFDVIPVVLLAIALGFLIR
jgi:hypothetical protein